MHSSRASDAPEADRDKPPHVTPEIASEAAVWVARLHGPDRSRAMERECLAWQARSAAHRLAFERCTDTWQAVSGITLISYARAAARSRRHNGLVGRVNTRRDVLASSALGCVALLAWRLWPSPQAYETGVGEQRIVMLADGTCMTLNTSTDVRVDMTKALRAVHVLQGEVLFEVAKDPGRPFVVQTAGTEVVATGTEFLVRAPTSGASVTSTVDITLIEGQVVVRGAQHGLGRPMATPIVMAPGERLRLRPTGAGLAPDTAARDRPRVDQLLAWKQGEVAFDDVPLNEAVVEVNRYSRLPILLVGADALGGLRVSGVFRAGDSAGFARAVAKLHGLAVRADLDRLELRSR